MHDITCTVPGAYDIVVNTNLTVVPYHCFVYFQMKFRAYGQPISTATPVVATG
jgi:hypothetical protein